METNTPITSDEALVFALHLHLQGKNISEIQDELVKKGMSQLDAQLTAGKAVEHATQPNYGAIRENNKAANRKILLGLIFLIGGLAITFVTTASGNGGVIAWGAILFGIIDIVIGASQRLNA